ncbi:MAG: DUF4136 domain-containing protein [Flavobacteriaceae bacterium]|nr:DUF4136 domain-containing protein [Flavobacteriaceae bacterium]
MKTTFFVPVLMLLVLSSCQSIRVASDYDKEANFTSYKTYAFLKKGIGQVEINDLDKKRILRSIENALITKGFSASENPDVLINIATDSRKNISVDQYPHGYYGFGYGWSPFYGAYYNNSVRSSTEGILYIDVIDASTKSLVWQGKGIGYLSQSSKERDARIQEFVTQIMEAYPPQVKANN